MKKFIFLFIFFLNACNETALSIDNKKLQLEMMSFEVVEKKLILETELPQNVENILTRWFDNKVKVNGIEGDMTFTIYDYQQKILNINAGKRVDISLKFKCILNKTLLSQRKTITGQVKSFGELTGTFSLNDLDILIENTQLDLIERLSRDLKLKI